MPEMHGHGKWVCSGCKKVVRQCRCPHHGNNITYVICDNCKGEAEKADEDHRFYKCTRCGKENPYNLLASHKCEN